MQSMAKKFKAANENGIYPSWPNLPNLGQPGRGTESDWESWYRRFDELIVFKHGDDFRYPDPPLRFTLPEYIGPGSVDFDWQLWVEGIKPWLEALLKTEAAVAGRVNGEEVVTAIRICDWLHSQLEVQAFPSAEMLGRAVYLGVIVERIYAMQFDLLAKSRKLQLKSIENQNNGVELRRQNLKLEAQAALSKAQIEIPNAGITAQQDRAAKELGITRRSLQRRLSS